VTQTVVLAALAGACIWNIATWWWGIPSSSSHALIGGLAGAVVCHAGVSAFKWQTLVQKVIRPLVLAPLGGFIIAFFVMVALTWMIRGQKPRVVHKGSRFLQLVSACGMAFSHGSNDAQKSMGVITLAIGSYLAVHHASSVPAWLVPNGDKIPLWVILSCAAAIAAGTLAGGKKIIKTMGSKIIRITPLQGFAAESSGALVIMLASRIGIPLSTTHVINACIMGVGASKRISAVRWGVAGNILIAWVVTLPLSALFSYLVMLGLKAAGL
jgi:inorganic phosphate transporter, PiT family